MRRVAMVMTAVVIAVTATACGGGSASTGTSSATSTDGSPHETLKVAFMYSGPARDGGWSQSFDDARQALQEQLGTRVETTYKESVPEGKETASVIAGLIREGNKLIIGTSYGEGQEMVKAAKANPDIYFLQSQWASPGLKNFAGFDNAPEDGSYVAGVAMGARVPQGAQVGWVDAFPIPYDLRTINGFALGVRHSNPSATVNVVMTNDWADANKMAQAARSLASSGAQGLGGVLSGAPIGQVAESKSLPYSASTSTDARSYGPQMALSSVVYDWLPMVKPAVESVLNGDWKSDFIYVGMKDGAVKVLFGPQYEKLDAKSKDAVEQAQHELESGQRAVFQGPIKDAAGKVVVESGKRLTPAELEAQKFVVPGVEGVKIEASG